MKELFDTFPNICSEKLIIKKKLIIPGIYLSSEANQLIALAEIFDYKKKIIKLL